VSRRGGRGRFPGSVYRHGTEPDPRFTLANERTFLAWIRTSLALIAGGVALEALAEAVHPTLRLIAALLLLVLGMAVPPLAWLDWAADERAMRLGAPLPHARVALPLAVGVVVVGALVLAGLVVR
jgi:putative membrane protein